MHTGVRELARDRHWQAAPSSEFTPTQAADSLKLFINTAHDIGE